MKKQKEHVTGIASGLQSLKYCLPGPLPLAWSRVSEDGTLEIGMPAGVLDGVQCPPENQSTGTKAEARFV